MWIIKRDKLDSDQRSVVDAPLDENLWIAGFAGSGKSVILVHKALDVLNRNPNARIVFLVYTLSLVDLFKTGLQDLGKQEQEIRIETIYEFMDRDTETYDYIFCDEVQDFTESMISSIRGRAKNKVVVAGDKFQSIYDQDVRGMPTIDPETTLPKMLNVQTRELSTIYRLTPSIIDAIDKFMPSMKLKVNGKTFAEKTDVSIKLCKCEDRDEEARYVYNDAERFIKNSERTAILFAKHQQCIDFANRILKMKDKEEWQFQLNNWNKPDYGSLNQHLSRNGIKLMYVGNGYGSLREAKSSGIGVMMTYPSSKGLDFDNVYMPYAEYNPSYNNSSSKSKTIFMVAMSRSSKNLTISYCGQPLQYVSLFSDLCTSITPNDHTTNVGVNFDF